MAIVVGVGLPLLLLVGAVRLLASDPDPAMPLGPGSGDVSPTQVSGRTDVFEAPFTYTLPIGWTVRSEGDRYFYLQPPAASQGLSVIILSSVVAAKSDCSDRPDRKVGQSSDAMTSWLSSHPALDATSPRAVTLGGATGSWVDVQLADDWDQSCSAGLALVTGQPDSGESWSIAGDGKIRFYVLDHPAGDTVTIVVEVADASQFNGVIDEVAPFVESIEFTS